MSLVLACALVSGSDKSAASYSGGKGLIAYARTPGEIFVVNPDGTYATNLTRTPGTIESDPTFMPDGSAIVFIRWVGAHGGYPDVFKMNVDGSGVTALTNTVGDYEYSPVPSPTGDRIAFIRGGLSTNLWIMNSDGSEKTTVTNTGDVAGSLSWRPDGNAILITTYTPDYTDYESDIFELDLSTGERRQLTRARGADHSPDYSPDGARIVYLHDDDPNDLETELHVINADGSSDRVLGSMEARDAVWSPDGSGLLVRLGVGPELEDANPRIELIDPDTGRSDLIFRDWFGNLSWQPCHEVCRLEAAASSEIGTIYPVPRDRNLQVQLIPFHVGDTLQISMYRRKAGTLRTVFSREVLIPPNGFATTEVPKLSSGKCTVVVRFDGDADHLPSEGSKSFSCSIYDR